ncbi:hypothetical protein CHS0354_018132 [Potamilus streckersoni]|uniref:Guanylate cyclase n=1 Tax=Potamilus streckersoni TaxID=2493646 RepID=A0AAE0STY7_9BIVA|nr:hypothetical protein CHS0354_018132 [Potamilus streckersoni]
MPSQCRKYSVFTCVVLFAIHASNEVKFKVGVLLMTNATEPFDIRRVGPALKLAFEVAKLDYGVDFEAIYNGYTDNCPKQTTIGHMAELYYYDHVKAFIGPACSQTLIHAGQLAHYLHVPMVTGAGELNVRTKETGDAYETTTTLSYNQTQISRSMKAIMLTYRWIHTVIMYDSSYIFFDYAGKNLVQDFRLDNEMARPYDIPFDPSKVRDYYDLLDEAKANARVFVIFCNAEILRDILWRAYETGFTDGDFVFITMELFPSDWLGHYKEFLRGDGKDAGVTKAYESVLILTLRQLDNPEYLIFADKVKRIAAQDFDYVFGEEEVNYFITAFYDSVIYLTIAINKTLKEGGNLTDGYTLARKLWNSSFPGITGTVAVDAQGNRIADFDLIDMMSLKTREFQRVGRFLGATLTYKPLPGKEIVWPKGLPIDVPQCGFKGELCISNTDPLENLKIIVGISVSLLALLVLAGVVGAFLYRKMKLENEIWKMSWLLTRDQIQMRKGRVNDSFLSKSLLTVQTGEENSSQCDRHAFTTTAVCKGLTVAIRHLHLKTFDLTRELMVEFTEMQRLHHKNLSMFVGICQDPEFRVLVMEYCPRGSLQDILENSSIDLDYSFRYSLIWDIVQGMLYLHGSSVGYHGRLSSTNCVIDSHFQLKLTDYGLQTLYMMNRKEEMKGTNATSFSSYKLLWVAPEHLRESQEYMKGSKNGDVYSFAIVLQEITLRSPPFDDCPLTADELIEKLKNLSPEILRPKIPVDIFDKGLGYLMKECWCENPNERLTFTEIQEKVRNIRVGRSTNIMDNLLQRMSQYADNLETLVTARTEAYLDEKKRTEELLYRLLPPSVAKQLELGNSVAPESYTCVTIYFSDIVKFTDLSATSTPIQVVEFLNQLYTAFDTTISNYEVYKVETIGDAYMVVSGLPIRNEDRHGREIANMSLQIRSVASNFRIAHRPEEKLKIRIGIHSGPVCAGVVGVKMPRYCLFGDTVNTASRMESNSVPQRIHMSSSTKSILERFEEYEFEERGEIEIKGKGKMKTYWLNGRSP